MTPGIDLALALSAAMGESLWTPQPVEGGLDAAATNFRWGDYFVKVRPDLPAGVILAREVAVPEVLAPLKVVALPDETYALVYPYIEAKDGFDRPLSLEHWETAGRALRCVHDHSAPNCGLETEGFHVLGTGALDSSPLASLVDANRSQIHWLIDETLELGRRLSATAWPLVPCHADLHVGNILTS